MAEEDNKQISAGLKQLTQLLKEESAADKTDNLIDEIRDLANSVKGLSSEFGKEFGSLINQSNTAILQQDVEGQESLQQQLGVLKEIAELQKKRNEKMAAEFTESIVQSELSRSINMTLSEQKKELESIKESETLASTEKLIERLEGKGSNEFSQQLSADFQELKTKLENPEISDEERTHYRDLLDKIGESGQSEEERREANKMSNKMIAKMDGIISGLEKFGQAVDDMLSNTAKGLGLAALALLFFDPETLAEILTNVIVFVTDTVHAIAKIFEGDFTAMADLVADHPILSTLASMYLALKAVTFFAKAIRSGIVVWQGLTKAFSFVMGAARWLMGPISWLARGIMALGPMLMSAGAAIVSGIGTALSWVVSTAIPAIVSGIGAAFSAIAGAIGSFFSAVLVPLAPFIAIGAAIAAVGYAIWEGVSRALDIFEETGSIMDAIVGGISGILGTLVALPFDILKSIVSTVAGWLGFEEFEAWLDSFSFADMFTQAFDAAFAMIGSVLSGLWDVVTWPFTALNDFIAETFGFDILGSLGAVLSGIWDFVTAPFTAIVTFVSGIFNGDGILESLSNALSGLWETVTWPFTAINDWIAETFGIDIGATLSGILGDLWGFITYPFTAINNWIKETFGVDVGQVLGDVLGGIWDAITEPLGAISDFIGQAFDAAVAWVKEKLSWIPGVGGLTDEQSAALDTATESGLYDKDLVGNSEINRDMVAQATMAQLDAIRADADLSEEDMKFIEDEIARRTPEAPTRGTEPTTTRPDFDSGVTAQETFDAPTAPAPTLPSGDAVIVRVPRTQVPAAATPQPTVVPRAEVQAAIAAEAAEAQQVVPQGEVTDYMSTVPLVEDVTGMFDNVMNWVGEKTEALGDYLSEVSYLEPVRDFIGGTTNWLSEQTEDVMGFLEEIGLFDAFKETFHEMGKFLKYMVEDLFDWVQEKLSWIPGIDAPEVRVRHNEDYNEGDSERLRQARQSAGLAPEGTNSTVEQNQAMTYRALQEQGFNETEISNMMGMMQGESGFRPQTEMSYANTSNERIREAMGRRVEDLSDAQLTELKQDPEAFYNHVYGGDMGNAADEGYMYRGRGFIQLTGKDNYERYGNMIGVDLVNNPELAADPEVASRVAAAYLKDRQRSGDNYEEMGDVYKRVYGVNPEDMRAGAARNMRMEDMAVREGYARDFSSRIASGSYNAVGQEAMVAQTGDSVPPVVAVNPNRTAVSNAIVAQTTPPTSVAGTVAPVNEGRTAHMVTNQVHNNDLAAQEKAASSEAAVVVAQGGGQSVRSNSTSVSAPTYHINNDQSPDRIAFDMISIPIG